MEKILDFVFRNTFLFEMTIAYTALIPLLKPRKKIGLRLLVCYAAILLFSNFVPDVIFGLPKAVSYAYATLWYIAIAALMMIGVRICFECNWWEALFYALSAYAAQHIFFRVKSFCEYFLLDAATSSLWLDYILYWSSFAIVEVLFYVLFVRHILKMERLEMNNKGLIIITLVVTLVAVALSGITMAESHGYRDLNASVFCALEIFSIGCCMLALNSLYSNVHNKQMKREAIKIQELWETDRRQYEFSKQTVELLNIKYHDIKAFLSKRQIGNDPEETREIERILGDYTAIFNTGNKTLDVVLTEKKLSFDKLGIKLICQIDGKAVSNLNPPDIYSMFYNALNNAEECLRTVEDPDKRLVTIHIARVREFVKIQIENYTPNEIMMKNGYPETTKADKENHGYGLKSIRAIVDKYGGFMRFGKEDDSFIMEVLIPL